MNEYIISNQIKCNSCGDTPYSANTHDFKWCSCKSVAVDGGQSYLRRSFTSKTGYQDQSITIDNQAHLLPLIVAATEAMESGRNPLGVTLAVLRGIRDGKLSLQHETNHWSKLPTEPVDDNINNPINVVM